ncbi:MAG: hypothetical protein RLZZ262_438, partial [Bacteroidota bacterium]
MEIHDKKHLIEKKKFSSMKSIHILNAVLVISALLKFTQAHAQFAEPEKINRLHSNPLVIYDLDQNGTLDALFSAGLVIYDLDSPVKRYVELPNIEFSNVSVADFDEDGITDILSVRFSFGNLSEYVKYQVSSDGEIDSGTVLFELPYNNYYNKVLDINNDGLLDLIRTGSTSETLPPRINNGQGNFYTTLDSSYDNFVACADIDGDTKSDLLYENSVDESVLYWRKAINGGDEFLNQGALIDFPGSSLKELVVLDKNNDGFDDIVLIPKYPYSYFTNYREYEDPYLYMNSGTGSFTTGSVLLDISNAHTLRTLDIDNDNDQDLLILGHLLLNQGNGPFQTITNLPFYFVQSATAFGSTDFRFFDISSASIAEITFNSLTQDIDSEELYSFRPYLEIHCEDLNADNFSDLVVSNVILPYESTAINHFFSDPNTRHIVNQQLVYNNTSANGVAIPDVNSDGRHDYITIAPWDNQNNGLFLSQPDQSYTLAVPINAPNAANQGNNFTYHSGKTYQITDLDNNGEMDIISRKKSRTEHLPSLVQINGVFTPLSNYLSPTTFGKEFYALDFDGDGDLDVLTENGIAIQTLPLTFQLLENPFKSDEAEAILHEFFKEQVLLADLNNDGFDDFALGNYIYFNDGQGQFENPIQIDETFYSIDFYPYYSESYVRNLPFVCIDYDGDGDLDFLYPKGSKLYLKEYDNNNDYKLSKIVFEGVNIFDITTNDWDNDGDKDILFLDGQTTNLYKIENLINHAYIISGAFFRDDNSNGTQDSGEPIIKGGDVSCDLAISSWTNTDGQFQMSFNNAGDYVIQATIDPYFFNLTNPSSITIALTEQASQFNTLTFGVSPTGNLPIEEMELYGQEGLIYAVENGPIYFTNIDNEGDMDYFTGSGKLYVHAQDQTESRIVDTGWKKIACNVSDFDDNGTTDFIAIQNEEAHFVSNTDNENFSGTLIGSACGRITSINLDLDNDMDLIIENCDEGIDIYLNNGQAIFTQQDGSAFNNFVSYFDFDLDGLKDIFFVDADIVSWRKNLGNFNFDDPFILTGLNGTNFSTTNLIDLNEDGYLDYFSDYHNNQYVPCFLPNTNNTSFGTSVLIDIDLQPNSGGNYSYIPQIIDVNGDNFPDILAIDNQNIDYLNQVYPYFLFLNNGDNSFGASQAITLDNILWIPSNYETYDYNSDGIKDIISNDNNDFIGSSHSAITTVHLLSLNSIEAIIPHVSFMPENMNVHTTLDGRQDMYLAFGTPNGTALKRISNTGDNSATVPINLFNSDMPFVSWSGQTNSIYSLNLNNDGIPDYYLPGQDRFFRSNTQTGQFDEHPGLIFDWMTYMTIRIIDLNNDGYDEILAFLDYWSGGGVHLFWNYEGSLVFQEMLWDATGIHDINADGLLDIELWNMAYMQTSDGVFELIELQIDDYYFDYQVNGFRSYNDLPLEGNNKIQRYDFNNDQLEDIMFMGDMSKNIGIRELDGTMTTSIFDETYFDVSTSFDVNGDLYDDIIYSKETAIYQAINNGDGTFATPTMLREGFNVLSLDHLDWDNDGDDDLIYCADYRYSNGQDGVYWLETLISSNKKIAGLVFLDANENGTWDLSEPVLSDWQVNLDAPQLSAFTNDAGRFEFQLTESATYSVNLETQLNWLNTSAQQYNVTLDDSNPSELNIQFGVIPEYYAVELEQSLQSTAIICSRASHVFMQVNNIGTTPADFQVALVFPSEFTFNNVYPAQDTIIGDTIYWDIDSLPMTQNYNIQVTFESPNFTFLGSSFTFQMITTTVEAQPQTYFNEWSNQPLLCAYDPNDKTSIIGHTDAGYIANDQTLDYLIRFQNTGNYYAFDVRVEDQLSSNLDWSSLHVVGSSHNMETSIDENGKVTFFFPNIMLPDSTMDEPNSHGFIRYSIQALDNLSHMATIENT